MGNRKRYTSEEKVKILREVLEVGKTISQAVGGSPRKRRIGRRRRRKKNCGRRTT